MVDLYARSIEIIRAGQGPSGAYVASPTFSHYGYSWLRDGAFIAYGMDHAGQHDSVAAFYRDRADVYYGGGEWVLLTAWLGWVCVRLGRVDEARVLKRWVEAQALPTGELPEQVSGALLAGDRFAEWEARWGSPASPLLWSHGMYKALESVLDDVDA